jgi:hypothetical protein
MYRYGNARHPYFSILRATEDRAYLEWSATQLQSVITPSGISDRSTFDARTGNTSFHSRFLTRRLAALDALYEKWYPHGQKVIPPDLRLTPLMLALWVADDGHIRHANTKCRDGIMKLKLSTDGFTKAEVDFLIDQLNERYPTVQQRFKVVSNRNKSSHNGRGYCIIASHLVCQALTEEIDSIWPPGIDRKAYWRQHRVKEGSYGKAKVLPTHCKKGHPYTPENTRWTKKNARICRQCSLEWQRAQTTRCSEGHEYTAENTWFDSRGRRRCRICSPRYPDKAHAAKASGQSVDTPLHGTCP